MVAQVKITKELEYDSFSLALRNDGIVRLFVKTNKNFEIADVKEIANALEKIVGEEKNALLVIASEYSLPNAEARAYVANKKYKSHTVAEAYVIKSFSQKLIGNVYLKIHKPVCPTRIFTIEESAIEWLKMYL